MIEGQPLQRHRFSWRRHGWPIYRQWLLDTDWPILVGPWRGEVGFEVLYWIPWIRRLIMDGVSPDRIIPITRGGAAVWYGCPTGIELYGMRSLKDVRLANAENVALSGFQKQVWTDFDHGVIADVRQTLGLSRCHVLHPVWMNHVLAMAWTQHDSLQDLCDRLAFAPLGVPEVAAEIGLPPHFAAVRFYGRSTFPISPATEPLVQAIIGTLATRLPVILLGHDLAVDDHLDFRGIMKSDVFRHTNHLQPVMSLGEMVQIDGPNNLAIESAIMAKADLWVGTYGGLQQLALRLGRPSVGLYSEWGATCVSHKLFSEFLSIMTGVPCQILSIPDLIQIGLMLPKIEIQQYASSSRETPIAPLAPAVV